MTSNEALPEPWADVAYYRYKQLVSETMRNVLKGRAVIEGCIDCPLFRVHVNGNFISTGCRVITRCIKQFPHILDNEEFK